MQPSGHRIATKTTSSTISLPTLRASFQWQGGERHARSEDAPVVGSERSNSHLAIPNYLFSPVESVQPSMFPAVRFPSSAFNNGGATVQFLGRGEARLGAT